MAHRFGMNQKFLIEANPEIWKITEEISPIILENLKKVIDNPKFMENLPLKSKCPICKTSHEAYDFFHAITVMTSHNCLHSGKFYEFLEKINYREK